MRTRNLTNEEVVIVAMHGRDGQSSRGSMSTEVTSTPYHGRLPRAWSAALSEATRARRISQVIYSYSTPIAWHDSQYGWIIPRVTYSATTGTKHQTHLWRLYGRHIVLPWDATPEDAQRVLDGKMLFETDRQGRYATRTVPGPNYVEGE